MEFDGHNEEQEEEIGLRSSYESLQNSSRANNMLTGATGGVGGGPDNSAGGAPASARRGKYGECLKNHALGLGVHAVDGCGEFLPAGEEGTLDALKCAACNCHRNFHRKETEGSEGGGFQQQQHHHQFLPYYRSAAPAGYFQMAPHHRPLALPSTSGGGGHSREDQEDVSNPSSGGSRKRFRTKFTQEQKEKMLAFAESVGWRIQKQDEAAVQQFCNETSVKRHVLKVWMHNNKHTHGKKP